MSAHLLGVAPMEGVTSFPMRLWLQLASAPAYMTTPFLRVTKGQPERQLPLMFAPELGCLRGVLPYQLTPQFLASDADNFLRAAALFDGVDGAIELNCGCPCPTCIGVHAGSGILAAPEIFAATTSRLVAALGSQRLAIKMRVGYASPDEFPYLLEQIADQPLARLTVHGRTRQQGYSGSADWHAVQRAAATCRAPTWGSGDVVDSQSFAAARQQAPQAVGTFIGRGLLRNPWIFADLRGDQQIIDFHTLAQALYVFALLQHLAMEQPRKLLARIANGRIELFCGNDSQKWEHIAAELSALVCGVPKIFSRRLADELPALTPNVWPRLRYLWSFLHTSCHVVGDRRMASKAKSTAEFFSAFLG